MRELVNQFFDIDLKFCTLPFLHKKLVIYRNCQYQATIAYSCHTDRTIKTKFVYEKLFLFDKPSSRNRAWLVVQGNAIISEQILQIEPL